MRRRGRSQAGHTLLEVVVASTVFALVVTMVMGMLSWTLGLTEIDMAQTHCEEQVQNAVDQVTGDLKETTPAKVTFYQFAEDGRAQTAICFPSARDLNNNFIYTLDGEVQSSPVWQSIAVYCYVSVPGQNGGWIYRYNDFSARSYTNPISVTSVTADTIALSDGTTFSRRGNPGAGQARLIIPGRFVQLYSELPATGDEGDVDFTLNPDLLDDAIQDIEVRPLRLTIRGEVEHRAPMLMGDVVVTTLTNEVLGRNRN
jgi:type II secretory pathway pseudopilin PulG